MEGFLGNLAVGKVLDLVYPRFCLRCKREGTAWCNACAANFTPMPLVARCPFCHREGSSRTCAECRKETSLDGLTCFVPYGNAVVREALTGWKYHGDPELARAIAGWVRTAATRAPDALPSASTVTHVPLHASRKRHRGFDQAEEIARFLATAIGAERASLLTRVEATSPQASRAASDRALGDLDHVFSAAPGSVPRRVILCDDVCTSGATIDAAARALKAGGAEKVWGFVVAVGG